MWSATLPGWVLLVMSGVFSAASGGFTIMVKIMYRLHVDAVSAHKERADAEERRAIAAEQRADAWREQFLTLAAARRRSSATGSRDR